MEFASMVLVVLLSQRVHVVDSPAINDRPIESPEDLYYTDPFYTRTAREKKIEGTVTIEATFDVRGCMKVLRTVKTVGFGLDENAVTALRSWRFPQSRIADRVLRPLPSGRGRDSVRLDSGRDYWQARSIR